MTPSLGRLELEKKFTAASTILGTDTIRSYFGKGLIKTELLWESEVTRQLHFGVAGVTLPHTVTGLKIVVEKG